MILKIEMFQNWHQTNRGGNGGSMAQACIVKPEQVVIIGAPVVVESTPCSNTGVKRGVPMIIDTAKASCTC